MSTDFSDLVEAAEKKLNEDYSSFPAAVQTSAGIGLAILALARAAQNVANTLEEGFDKLNTELNHLGGHLRR